MLIKIVLVFIFTTKIVGVLSSDSDNPDLCNKDYSLDYDSYITTRSEQCDCVDPKYCVRKCCQYGFSHVHTEDPTTATIKSTCVRSHKSRNFTVPVYRLYSKQYNLEKFMVGMLECGNAMFWQYFKMNNSDPIEKTYIQENGSLFYPSSSIKIYQNDRYCVDEADGFSVYLCYTPESPDKLLRILVNVTGL